MGSLGASLMCADFLNLKQQIYELEQANIDSYHIDIMDGQFVDNFALSIDFIRLIRPLTKKTIDVHLMVINPERYIDTLVEVGADIITIHSECTRHLQGTLAQIKKHNVKAGVALNPSTPVDSLAYVYDQIDVLLIMTVNPGFAGQKFLPTMYEKVKYSHEWRNKLNKDILIQVDGNISQTSLSKCHAAGADMYVLGTSLLFNNLSIKENLDIARNLLND